MKSKITDFRVRVWGNDVFIHNRDNIDYACMAEMEGFQCNYREGTKEYADLRRVCGEMTDNLQCDIPKGTEDECVIRSRCMDIVRDVMVIIDRTLSKNSTLSEKI